MDPTTLKETLNSANYLTLDENGVCQTFVTLRELAQSHNVSHTTISKKFTGTEETTCICGSDRFGWFSVRKLQS
tara:strand:+ start:255 stop:476 length:222 start_codon:yes stop_codon:yes gene_type:complete